MAGLYLLWLYYQVGPTARRHLQPASRCAEARRRRDGRGGGRVYITYYGYTCTCPYVLWRRDGRGGGRSYTGYGYTYYGYTYYGYPFLGAVMGAEEVAHVLAMAILTLAILVHTYT